MTSPIYRGTTTPAPTESMMDERDMNPRPSTSAAVVDDLVQLPPLTEEEDDDSGEDSPRPLSPSVAVASLNPPPPPSPRQGGEGERKKGKGKGRGKSSEGVVEESVRRRRAACDLM